MTRTIKYVTVRIGYGLCRKGHYVPCSSGYYSNEYLREIDSLGIHSSLETKWPETSGWSRWPSTVRQTEGE